ncbi:TRAP transporter small permease [Syntrophothermus sp.]|uniref:TRAP transporter small permease n=1 Tax=Syntrophothermus sp. TaxID=2736299 RepID=UPI00338E64DD
MRQRFIRALELIGVLALLSIETLLVVQVVARLVFSISLSWAEELARYSHIWLVFVGAAVATCWDAHIQVDFFTAFLPKGALRQLRLGVAVLGAVFSSLFFSSAVLLISQLWATQTASTGMPFPVFFMPVVIGGAFLIVAFLWSAMILSRSREAVAESSVANSSAERGGLP